MDSQLIERRKRRGGALALAALAGLALLLAWTASGDTPDPAALAQEGATRTSTATPPFTSPRSTPTFTRTPRAEPVPQPIAFITDPREAYALSQRYRFLNRGDGDAQGADASQTQLDGGEAPMHGPLARSLYFPLIRRGVGPLAWYKGTGQSIVYREHSFVYSLGVTWWYDWQHEYAWEPFVTGRKIVEPRYQPMVWCPNLPGEPGVPPEYSEPDRGLWNPDELADKARRYPGRTWLIFNEPDFPPSIDPRTPAPMYSYQQCGRVLCGIANYATLPAPVVLPPNVAPTPTQTWTPTPIPPPGSIATATPLPVWPCSWPTTTPYPDYYNQLRAKMIRIAADRYAQIYRIIKASDPTAKVFCCGNFDAGYTTWLADFLQQLRLYHSDVKIDGLAIHAYPWGSSVPLCWNSPLGSSWTCMQLQLEKNKNDFRNIGAPLVPDAPIWITETGYLGIPTVVSPPLTMEQVQQYVMDPMIVWLQSGSTGYQAVAWFISIGADPPQTNLFVATAPEHTPSAMTILGARWATVTPAPARAP